MNVPRVFWIALAVFEIAFGTAIFVVTRSYYRDQVPTATPASFDVRSLDFPASNLSASRIDPDRPRSPQEVAELADAHFANRQYSAALGLYEQLLGQDPANVDLLNNLALTLHYIGRSDEALNRLEEGIALDGAHQRIRLTHGFVLNQVGRSTEAVDALNAAIQLNESSEIADSARRMLAEAAAR